MTTEIAPSPTPAERRDLAQASPAASAPVTWPFSVSIVIPAFNEARTIARVIHAAREQCPAAEIIVVDDASRDGTADQAAATALYSALPAP